MTEMSPHENPPAMPLNWHRFVGAFANVGSAGRECSPTVGVAYRQCSCCAREYLVLAAIGADGSEVNVGLPMIEAIEFAEKVVGIIAGHGRTQEADQ
ncbi:MAG: hypothetical protein ACTHM0_13505 [Sphingomonas sp.]